MPAGIGYGNLGAMIGGATKKIRGVKKHRAGRRSAARSASLESAIQRMRDGGRTEKQIRESLRLRARRRARG